MLVSRKILIISCCIFFIILISIVSAMFILDDPCGISLYNTSTSKLEYKKCGLVNLKGKDNGYIAFLVEIKGFYQIDKTLYATFNFGSLTESFSLGEIEIYSININESRKNKTSSDPADSTGNLIKLNSSSATVFSKKYIGKYAEVFLPTSRLKNERLTLINAALKSKTQMEQTQLIVTRERQYWSNCPQQLDTLVYRLKQNDKLALLNHSYDKNFNIDYKKCLPVVYNMEIFL